MITVYTMEDLRDRKIKGEIMRAAINVMKAGESLVSIVVAEKGTNLDMVLRIARAIEVDRLHYIKYETGFGYISVSVETPYIKHMYPDHFS